MKNFVTSIAISCLLLTIISNSAPADALDDKEILDLKTLVQEQDDYITHIEKQRDRFAAELKKEPGDGLPFYFWIVLGAAGSAFLIKGFSK